MKSQNLRTVFKRPVPADAEDGRRRCSKELRAASRGWKRQEHGPPLKPHRMEAALATLRDTHFRLLTSRTGRKFICTVSSHHIFCSICYSRNRTLTHRWNKSSSQTVVQTNQYNTHKVPNNAKYINRKYLWVFSFFFSFAFWCTRGYGGWLPWPAGPEIKSCSLQWKRGVLNIGPPRKSPEKAFK